MRYALVTSARNEEAVIRFTLEAVITQRKLPERWIIVDDGSTDRTAAIVKEYRGRHRWIELVQRPRRADRSFAGKAHAVNEAFHSLLERGLQFDVLGNLDADVSFAPDYVKFLLDRFGEDGRLGVAGTPFTQDGGYDSSRDSFEGHNYVAGPFQLFRLECFRDIGGYVANHAGGVDWIAVMTARMMGWTVRAFPERRFHHHRPLGTAERNRIEAMFSYGQKDYYLGGSPLWQILRAGYQTTRRPFVVGGLSLLAGYAWACMTRVPRVVSPELIRFHRADQMRKLRAVFSALSRFERVDAFQPGVTERGKHA
jgi:glycosyltransferase involved in cell wall biosynthesis